MVLDNLNVHKSAHARQAIANARCELRFLPTYSPDLNPIELANSVYKHRMRRLRPRSHEEVIAAQQSGSGRDHPGQSTCLLSPGYGRPEPNRQPFLPTTLQPITSC